MGWLGNNTVSNKPKINGSTTYLGNGLNHAGKFANDHAQATRFVECATGALVGVSALNVAAKRFAPNQHQKFVAEPIEKFLVTPLQNKGILSKPKTEERPAQRGYLAAAVNIAGLGLPGYLGLV